MASQPEQKIELPKTIEFIFNNQIQEKISIKFPYVTVLHSKFIANMIEIFGIQSFINDDNKINIMFDIQNLTKDDLQIYFDLVEIYYKRDDYDDLVNQINKYKYNGYIPNISPNILCNYILLSDYLNFTSFLDALCKYTGTIL
jgi:hypothetical protein